MLVLFSYNKPSTVRIHDRNIKIPVGIKKKVNSMARHPRHGKFYNDLSGKRGNLFQNTTQIQ